MNPLRTLYSRLCRELAQSERVAANHAWRDSWRLGDTPPARALRALSVHAQAMRPHFEGLVDVHEPIGVLASRRIGEWVSALRHVLFERFFDLERSYRNTVLGFHHGLAVARLLRDVADRLDETDMVKFCDDWLAQREVLVDTAERELHWFAEMPRHAIRSGLRVVAFGAAHE